MKRGSLLDLFGLLAIVLALTIVALISSVVYVDFKSTYEIARNTSITADETAILAKGLTLQDIYANSIPFLFMMFGLGIVILAYFVPSHPIFLPVSIITSIILIIVAAIFSDVAWAVLNDPLVLPVSNGLPLMVAMWRNMPMIMAILSSIITVLTYSRGAQVNVGTGQI